MNATVHAGRIGANAIAEYTQESIYCIYSIQGAFVLHCVVNRLLLELRKRRLVKRKVVK